MHHWSFLYLIRILTELLLQVFFLSLLIDRFLLLARDTFPRHIICWGTCDMINGTVYVFCFPKAYKDNIWTWAWFNEQDFLQIFPKLYSAEYLSGFVEALWYLLIGPHRTNKGKRLTCAHTHKHTPTHTHTHINACSLTQASLFQPNREWWLSLSPQSKMATVPLLSRPIKLPDSFIVLVFDNFLSSVIRSASGSCCMGREGLGEGQELTWKGTAGGNCSLL